MKNEECDFCNSDFIVRQVIFNGKYSFIVYPRSPINAGHLMIMPKRHVESIDGLSAEEILEIKALIDKASSFLLRQESYSGLNILCNIGKSAGQHIKHIHFHLFFRSFLEEHSPLDILAKKCERELMTKEEWEKNIMKLRSILK